MHTLNAQSASDRPPKPPATWRWISRWPSPAQYALVTAMFLSGSQLMGSYRWIQGVVCAAWMAWLLLEVFFDREDPRLQSWSWWRYSIFVVGGFLGLIYIVYDLVSRDW